MDYQPIINLLISYIEIEKDTNKTKSQKVETILNKFRIVLPSDMFESYYFFITYFLDIYLVP